MASKTSRADTNAIKQQLESDNRDITDMWNDAVKSYHGILGVRLQPQFANTSAMIEFGTEQMSNFHHFRHNQKKVDKLRTLFATNLDYINAGANQLVAAATPAFPPAAAIGTALTYMLQACKQVSADYDVVTAFFEDMNSFLQRITILETRLPRYKAYRNCLMDVFSSVLNMCGFATKYIELGRFKKWVLNMIRGEDSDLGNARKGMDTSLSRLQSATEYAILGNTEELQKMNGELQENQEAQTRMLQEQTEMLESVLNSQDNVRSDLQNITKLLQVFQEGRKSGDSAAGAVKGKTGAQSRPPTSNRIISYMPATLNPAFEYHNIKDNFVADTCTWLFEEPVWRNWMAPLEAESRQPFLIVSGRAGMGKSHLAVSTYDHLVQLAGSGHESGACVVHFYFRETEEELKYFVNAMVWMVIQIAEQSVALCEKLNVEISREDLDVDVDDWKDIWENLVVPLFEAENAPRLQIVFDGVDEMDEEERGYLIQFLKTIKDKPKLNVSALCTTRPGILPVMEELNDATITVEKQTVLPDLKSLIWSRLDKLSGLRKFSRYVKQKIASRLEEAADCLLYGELMLKRFSATGREGAVLKDLEQSMPDSLDHLYQTMLSECHRRTPSAQQQYMKILLAWLAFAWRPLTLNECKVLLKFLSADDSLDLEEELQGRFSGFLLIGNSSDGAPQERTKTQLVQKVEELEQMDSNPDKAYDDGQLPVKFQTRSMRGFFRDAKDKDESLRMPSSGAHRLIFIACSQILRTRISDNDGLTESLREYAAKYWAVHEGWVYGVRQTEAENVAFVESLAAVLVNEENCASQIEAGGNDYQYQMSKMADDAFIKNVLTWASWASRLDESKLSQIASTWAKDVKEDMWRAMVPLAKGHVANWFKCRDVKSTLRPFRFSRSAVLLTSHRDVVHIDESDDDDSSGSSDEEDEDKNTHSAEEILGVATALKIDMDSRAHFAVSAILEQSSHHEEALSEAQTSLSLCTDTMGRFEILNLKADILFSLEQYQDAHDSVIEALAHPDLRANLKTKALHTRARIEDKLGNIEESIKAYEEARLADPSAMVSGDLLKEEINVLERKDATELVLTLRKWNPLERLTWMTWMYADDGMAAHETFRKATVRTQDWDFLVYVYEEAIELLNPLDSAAPIQLHLAFAHWWVRKDADAALEIFNAILDASSQGYWYAFTNEDPSWILTQVINHMSDVLYELFRSSNNPEWKARLLADARALNQRPLARSLMTTKSELVHHTVVVAKMTRKMASSRDFHDELQKAFSLCYESLNDSVGWNDSENLEALAEVLFAVDSQSLEREARIAYSAVFSDLNPTIGDSSRRGADEEQQTDNESESDDDGEGEDEDNDENERDCHQNSNSTPHDVKHPNTLREKFDTIEYGETCYGTCDPTVTCTSGWEGRSMYRCLVCYDCNLCEDCYGLRQRLNQGDKLGPVQHFCGLNHKYVKGPIEGWKGVKNGKMYIGDEEIPFKDWLRELKEVKWKQAWDTFWLSED